MRGRHRLETADTAASRPQPAASNRHSSAMDVGTARHVHNSERRFTRLSTTF